MIVVSVASEQNLDVVEFESQILDGFLISGTDFSKLLLIRIIPEKSLTETTPAFRST